ncbi:motile sperm domain-containing protein 2-like [Tropilaelaps mercedesae]|uniref:Motile sperm domain-containing protein 2-like n=1 Tax=Tropilaelaps mercedesae TaxID=418985 RepID=A0A1V9XKF0_9ACAR|nr:motile sperm domain-containing protein 2-like [Tropilaelaps mercedesae]
MLRSRYHQKPRTGEERLEHQKLVAHVIEQLVVKRGVKKLALMFDCQHTGISNTDIDAVKFIITLFRDYYPYVLEKIYVVELPWILQATWRLIRSLLSVEAQKLIVFKAKGELKEDIDPSNLPKWLDGEVEVLAAGPLPQTACGLPKGSEGLFGPQASGPRSSQAASCPQRPSSKEDLYKYRFTTPIRHRLAAAFSGENHGGKGSVGL